MKSAALVVAHPDDESLFFGGLVITEPWDWTIICCSIPRADPIRAWKFFDACNVLGAKGRLLPFSEAHFLGGPGTLHALDLSGFDHIVTHGAAGEYGHEHHKALNRYVRERWPHKPVTMCGTLWKLTLNVDQRARKIEALRCYDHISPMDGIPKWQAILKRYPEWIDVERYDEYCP